MGWSAAAMVAVSAFTANEQIKAQKEAKDTQSRQLEEAQARDLEVRRIAASAKPIEQNATLLTSASKSSVLGNLGLMVEPTKKNVNTLGGTTQTGLGFGGNT